MTSATTTRLDVAFPSDGDHCKAWLFMPDAERSPLVILGHGLGGTRELGLEPYAQRFADAGIAALVFTYRHFGDSGGSLASCSTSNASWPTGPQRSPTHAAST